MGTGLLITVIALCIPVVAILSNAYVKVKKMELEHMASSESYRAVQELEEKVTRLQDENSLLKERVLNIETIVAEPDWELLIATTDQKTEKGKFEKLKKLTRRMQKGEND